MNIFIMKKHPFRFFKTKKELISFIKKARDAWKNEEAFSIQGPPVIRVFNDSGLVLNQDLVFRKNGTPKLFNSAQAAINLINKNKLNAQIGVY